MTAVCRNGYERNERILSGTGWTKEGIVRKVMKIKNEFVDAAVYGMLKDECKWIRK
jgi:RimJ/RimL family protein N-acetyltransferase